MLNYSTIMAIITVQIRQRISESIMDGLGRESLSIERSSSM